MKILITKKQEQMLLEQVMGKAPNNKFNINVLPEPFKNEEYLINSVISIIKKHEGFCDGIKKCPPHTIGYGTRTDLHPELKGKKIDDVVATAYIKKDLKDQVIPAIKRMVKVPLKDNQNVALMSLVYNIGTGNFRKSQLLKDLNRNNMKGVKKNWEEFINSEGKKLGGLVGRRGDEIQLFFGEK